MNISIHKALASLDPMSVGVVLMFVPISIHKALASLDITSINGGVDYIISIHKALASLDHQAQDNWKTSGYFNPQGSREPRRNAKQLGQTMAISIHKALASLDYALTETH